MRKNARKILISTLVALLVGLVAFVLTGAMSDGTPKKVASNTVLAGEYHQTNSGIPSSVMSATVRDGSIEIVMHLNSGVEGDDSGVTSKYWAGTFNMSNMSDSFTVVSKVDKKALEFSIVGSQDDVKVFNYDHGDLSFPFSMMGMTTTVHLSK